MIKVQIKVTSFTRKILSKDFGSSITINKRHLLFPFVTSQKSFSDWSRENDSIEFVLPPSEILVYRPGLALHRYCVNKMNEFVFAQVLAKVDAMQALRNFYSKYDIDEDDFSMESSYKSFQRFIKQENSNKESKKQSISVLQNWTIFSIDELENILGIFTLKHFSNHLGKTNVFKTILIKQSRIYIYHHIGRMSVKEISSLLKIPTDTIYKHLKRYHKKVVKGKVFPFPQSPILIE